MKNIRKFDEDAQIIGTPRYEALGIYYKMSERIKRLRVFAGPNGSGKSSLYNSIPQWFDEFVLNKLET